MTVASFIIAGTEKAGTTSVFSYLAQHPEVTASRRKETNFFRSEGTRADYAAHFPSADGRPVVMEASPAYLGEAQQVIPRMRAMVPDVKLLFILREPVARFVSSYYFHRGKLNLPEDLSLTDYFDACREFAAGDPAGRTRIAREQRIGEWYLKVLEFGCYAGYLRRYFDAFPREQIRVALYDDLCEDPRSFMEGVSDFLGIERRYWANADYRSVNVTFAGRSRGLHRIAVFVNDRLETLLRPRPKLKSAVVSAYKRLNGAGDGYQEMAPEDRQRLEDYYAPHNDELEALLGIPLPGGWGEMRRAAPSAWSGEGRRAAHP
jgi:Sulfotransferase domain